MIVIDTSVLSSVFRRRSPGPNELHLRRHVTDLLNSDEELALPGIVLQEFLTGIRSDRQFASLEAQLLASFTVLIPTVADHIDAARLCNACLNHGVTASGSDCLIASVTIVGGHELFTLDRDFRNIARFVPLKLFVPAAK